MAFDLSKTTDRIYGHYKEAYKGFMDDFYDRLSGVEAVMQSMGLPADSFAPPSIAQKPESPPEVLTAMQSCQAGVEDALPDIQKQLNTIRMASTMREARARTIRTAQGDDDRARGGRAREERLAREREKALTEIDQMRRDAEALVRQKQGELEQEIRTRMNAILVREAEIQQKASAMRAEAESLAAQERALVAQQEANQKMEADLKARVRSLNTQLAQLQSVHKQKMSEAARELETIRSKRTDFEQNFAVDRARREDELHALEAEIQRMRTECASAGQATSTCNSMLSSLRAAQADNLSQSKRLISEVRASEVELSGELERSGFVTEHKHEIASAVVKSIVNLKQQGVLTGDGGTNMMCLSGDHSKVAPVVQEYATPVGGSSKLVKGFTNTADPQKQGSPKNGVLTSIFNSVAKGRKPNPADSPTQAGTGAGGSAALLLSAVGDQGDGNGSDNDNQDEEDEEESRMLFESVCTKEPAIYRIPANYDANISGDNVPVAEWACGELLKRCIVLSTKINPDTIYPPYLQRATVQELFGIANHPFDNRARQTQNWQTDKLSAREIESYNLKMGFGVKTGVISNVKK